MIRILKETYEADPMVSYGYTAKQLGVSRKTVSRGLGDLGMRSYVRRYRALISSGAMVKRVERSEDLLEWICAHPNTVIIFSDKVQKFECSLCEKALKFQCKIQPTSFQFAEDVYD